MISLPPLYLFRGSIFPPKLKRRPIKILGRAAGGEREGEGERQRGMSTAAMRKKVQRKFKMRGYAVKVEAVDVIISFVSQFSGEEEEDEALNLVLDQLEHESRTTRFILSIFDKDFSFLSSLAALRCI